MKKLRKSALAMALAVMMGLTNPFTALADFVTQQHGVTVVVPEVLSIKADIVNFTLRFTSFRTGSLTNTQTVSYTVESNGMAQPAGGTAINANLDAIYPDQIVFEADPGVYTKTSGNTTLVEKASGFIPIQATNTAIGVKGPADLGTDGKILSGTFPVTYRARAAGTDLAAATHIRQLFVTLTTT